MNILKNSLESITKKINEKNQACVVMDMAGNWHIITRQDLILAMSNA